MKFLKLSLILIVVSLGLVGCNYFGKKESSTPKLLVINVLDKTQYDDCHIKGSINVPFEQVEQFAKDLDKNTEIVVYCSNYLCTGSGTSAKILQRMGFTNVWAYEAGMAEWHQNGLPVEGNCKEQYLTKKMEKPTEPEDKSVRVITTQELKEKLKF